MTTPTTAAGRALLDELLMDAGEQLDSGQTVGAAILAIEAEARAAALDEARAAVEGMVRDTWPDRRSWWRAVSQALAAIDALDALPAIEAEARAAALDAEALAMALAPYGITGEGVETVRRDYCAAIDALRERDMSGPPDPTYDPFCDDCDGLRERDGDALMVTAPDYGQQYSTRGALIRHTTKRERSGE